MPLRVVERMHIAASCERASAVLWAYGRWPDVFPAITGTELRARADDTLLVRVDHTEGIVMNRLSRISRDTIRVEEWKRRYDAVFTNVFVPHEAGCLYELRAVIHLKGAARLLQPALAGVVRRRMVRLTMLPLRRAAEAQPGST